VAEERRDGDAGTATQILDVAERLVQQQGYQGFSYADVAGELGLTKAALHYHFASKAELGEALIERYSSRFMASLDSLDQEAPDARAKLAGYVRRYVDVVRADRLCLCGMLAAEYRMLPAPMREAVVAFFEANEAWLTGVLDEGVRSGQLHLRAPADETARLLVGGLEGAMLVGRPTGDARRFEALAHRLVDELTAPAVAGRRGQAQGRAVRVPQ